MECSDVDVESRDIAPQSAPEDDVFTVLGVRDERFDRRPFDLSGKRSGGILSATGPAEATLDFDR
jgi:hypothetical protein